VRLIDTQVMNKLLILAALVAALAVPASAAGKTPVRNPSTTAAAIAEGYWGAVPCGGQITIVANARLATGLDAATDGWVTFNSALGADNLNAPASTYSHCRISLAHWRWASWKDMESDWGMFCLTVVHEMGHLLGHKHSLTPGSVMAPVFKSDANVPKVCNATWLPGLRRGR
jgi:Matrixin